MSVFRSVRVLTCRGECRAKRVRFVDLLGNLGANVYANYRDDLVPPFHIHTPLKSIN